MDIRKKDWSEVWLKWGSSESDVNVNWWIVGSKGCPEYGSETMASVPFLTKRHLHEPVEHNGYHHTVGEIIPSNVIDYSQE